MRVIIYEDSPEDLYPLTNILPQFSLRIGMKTIAEHTAAMTKPSKMDFIARPLFGFSPVKPTKCTLYLSSKVLLKEGLSVPPADVLLKLGNESIGFEKCKPPFPRSVEDIKTTLVKMSNIRKVSGILISKLWDLIAANEALISLHFGMKRAKGVALKGLDVCGSRKNIFVAQGAKVHKNVVVDVTGGPVYIDRGARIKPFTSIIGPAYIGPGTEVDQGKVIKSSIGPECRISGEVESCIFQGYANKHHTGFIGHSCIGEWVNIGALTTNSDLKNNYGTIRLRIGQRRIETGQIKLGCFVGDHTKFGIGTLIPTGAVIGSFVNFAGGGMMPTFVPDFRWLTADKDEGQDLDKALSTARVVMKRRNVKMSKRYELVIRAFHEKICSGN